MPEYWKGSEQAPRNISAIRTWGRKGNKPGEFNEPRGIAVAPNGDVFVTDTGNSRVQKFDKDGKYLFMWGTEGENLGEFKNPQGITVSKDGFVYVSDTWNHRVQKFSLDGTSLGEFRTQDKSLFGPRDIAISPFDGNIYVADTGNKQVAVLTPDGQLVKRIGSPGEDDGQFIEPVGVAVDNQGRLYVANTGNKRIEIFDSAGNFEKSIPVLGIENFYTEPYIAIFPGGIIYIADSSRQVIHVYNPDFKTSYSLGGEGTDQGRFNGPKGIAVDPEGNYFVVDSNNHRIQKFNLSH